MRNRIQKTFGASRRTIWSSLLVYVLAVHFLAIGILEGVSYILTGRPSALMAGFGLVAAVLFSCRRAGETYLGPTDIGGDVLSD